MSKLAAKFANYDKLPTDNIAVGNDIQELINMAYCPTCSVSYTYDSSGIVQNATVYKNSTQINVNRRLRYDFTYDSEGRVTEESIGIYNFSDGTTLEKTTAYTFSYNTNDEITNVTQATT